MTAIEHGKERRQHQRIDIDSGAFALLRSGGMEVLGSIKDISAGGISLSHIDENDGFNDDLSIISVKLMSETLCYENFSGRNVWSKKEEGGFISAMVQMKHRGIEFAQLDNEKQLQLQNFINSLTRK